jgi:hypothetical protein
MISRLLLGLSLTAYLALAPSVPRAAGLPALFFYPAPITLEDESVLSSPLTIEATQITTSFPKIKEMSGVALLVYWSKLCPERNSCDFSIINQVLNYWQQANKKVVLGVATIGFPVKTFIAGKALFQDATPGWVLADAGSYQFRTRTLGKIGGQGEIEAPFPQFWQGSFLHDTKQLVDQLARFDGNPTISQVRISTGLMTEDNPMVGHVNQPMPGYSEEEWLEYCEEVTALYLNAFHRTQLEFDVGRILVAYDRGSPSFRGQVDGFLQQLRDRHVFLAYDGLRSESLTDLHATDSMRGPSLALQWVRQSIQSGAGGGLEGAPLISNKMDDVGAIAAVVRELHPQRLILWSTEAGSLNYLRKGPNPENALLVKIIGQQNLVVVEEKSRALLGNIGFPQSVP